MNKKGFALMVAIFVVIVFAVLGIVVVSLMSGENILSLRDYNSIRAFHLAEAGIRYTLAFLKSDSDWRDNANFSKNLSPGYFTIAYTYKSRTLCIVKVTGVAEGISRSITVGIKKGGLPGAFDYAVYASNPSSETLDIQNSATIYGDYYYNGPVIMENESRLLNGTLYSESLELRHTAYCASWEPITIVDPPAFDTTYYDNLLAETTKSASGPLDINSGTKYISGTEYYTSITIGGTAVVIGPGTLVATTGNFILQSDDARISDEVTVIVKGTSSFNNSCRVGLNFNLISNGSITINNDQDIPEGAILFSYGDVTFDNASQFWGCILAPNREMSSSNATIFNGLIYAKKISLENATQLNGSVVTSQIGYFKNVVTVTYDPAKFPATIPQGFEGAGSSTLGPPKIYSWFENF